MSISLLIIVLVPLLMSPIYTYEAYQNLYEREAAHIAVDNAGIVLGQNDRSLFNQLILSNKIAKGFEVPHHVAHTAAKVPLLGRLFQAQDKALEVAIALNHIKARALAEMQWNQGRWKVRSEFSKLKMPFGKLERNRLVPIKERRCAQCGATPYWEISETPIRSKIIGNSDEVNPYIFVELSGKSIMSDGRWNYKMYLE